MRDLLFSSDRFEANAKPFGPAEWSYETRRFSVAPTVVRDWRSWGFCS